VNLASRPEELLMRLEELPHVPVDVLIADDDADLRHAVRMLLEAQGLSCAEATDGIETVEFARAITPQCVLLDLAMPGLDGLNVARRLRQDPRTAGLHIHCLTGQADPVMRQQAEEAGCELFLTKPVDPIAVVAAVRGWSGLSKAEAEELLDWLETHGEGPAELAYENGGGFSVRLRRETDSATPQRGLDAPADKALLSGTRSGSAGAVQRPVAGRAVRYMGVYHHQAGAEHIAVRISRVPTVALCVVAALGLLAAFAWGMMSLAEVGVLAALLVVLAAIPPEERWLPHFPQDFQRGPGDCGGRIEFDGVVTDLGRFGLRQIIHRRVRVLRVVHYEPGPTTAPTRGSVST
jgi:CheY-like chemotaxis protein